MNLRRVSLLVVMVVLVVVLDVSFIGASVYLRPRLILPLVLAVIGLHRLRYDRNWTLVGLAAITGIVLDLFSAYPFGVLSLALVTSVVVTQLVVSRFLPRQSLISLVIAVILSSACYAVTVGAATALWHALAAARFWYQPTMEHAHWLLEQILIHCLLAFGTIGLLESRPMGPRKLIHEPRY